MKINKTENLHKHIKGSYKDYDPEVHKHAIYFAEDKKKIIVDGAEYGLDLESDEVDLISNIEHKDNKLIITFSNSKTKEIELEDHRAYWEKLRIEDEFPKGGCVINTYPIKEFSFKGDGSGKWYSSDGQEGEYDNRNLTTITFKEEGEYTIKLVNTSYDGQNSLETITEYNIVKSVLMIGGSNGKTGGVSIVDREGSIKLILYNNITHIGYAAFASSLGYTGDLIIPEGVISIGNKAFENCSRFTGELKLPESITSIGNSAFENCGFTGELKLPDSLTSIGEWAFRSCSGFTNLKLPDSLTSIGEYTFYECSGFTGDLIIPESVVSIGFRAFSGCKGLSKIYVCEDTTLRSNWNLYTPAEVIKYKKGEKPWLD